MKFLKPLSRSIFVWMGAVSVLMLFVMEFLKKLGQVGALENESWFIHAVSNTVTQLSQQRRSVVDGAVRLVTGVKGKTYPFNRIGSQDMEQMTTRDAQTNYANPPQTKRRCKLLDFALAVLIDEFDELKTLTDPQSELSQILGYALERKKDDLVLSQSTTNIGGALGTAETVDEGAESTSQTSMVATYQIANGGAGLTMAKVRSAKRIMAEADVMTEDQYVFYSPKGMEQLMTDPTCTSADFSTINALSSGGYPTDATWYGAKWRQSNKLYKTGNIRSCLRIQKMGIGMAMGLVKQVELGKDPGHWNNTFAMVKLSGGSVRVDDTCVIQIDIDESV